MKVTLVLFRKIKDVLRGNKDVITWSHGVRYQGCPPKLLWVIWLVRCWNSGRQKTRNDRDLLSLNLIYNKLIIITIVLPLEWKKQVLTHVPVGVWNESISMPWYTYGTSSHLLYPFLPLCKFPFRREAYKRLTTGGGAGPGMWWAKDTKIKFGKEIL